ncbi:MAG TPA: SpoIVB peptidase S55 domain-containing protein, partial [Actinomycetota bacterium]|nr:SpoIVB peptidase S55 domain-containing protein [Actinomycetota bacterium]
MTAPLGDKREEEMRTEGARPFLAALTRVAAGVALIASLLFPAQAGATPVACPQPYPVENLEPGMTATGYTVEKGYEPTPFDVEILGVMPNALAPGKDLIIIEAGGPMMERVGTIWAGMSGSPVYRDGKLIGAVAYGLTWGPSLIGGVTPAEDMFEVLSYPEAQRAAEPRRVRLDDRTRRTVARSTGVQESQIGSMERLLTPLSLSGVSGRGLSKIRDVLTREKAPFIAHTGGSSSGSLAPGDTTIEAGDSFAGALSYGDLTAAGVGTATFVCNGKVIAFGHPFFFNGSTTLGANAARALTVVSDPVFGAYKLATIEGSVGTVDQDRFSAIRATLGTGPSTIPIDSTVTSLDTGKSRDGQTRSVLSRYVPFLAFVHSFLNIDVVFDQIGPGSSSLTWRITGTTSSGAPWELNRANRHASRYDVSFDSLWELLDTLFVLESNRFEEIEFTGIDIDVDVEETVRQYTLTKLTWSLDGRTYNETKRVPVRGRETLYLRAELEPFDGGATRTVDLTLN